LPTVETLARQSGYAGHQIRYVLKSRRIAPDGRVGAIGVYLPDTAEKILRELDAIAAQRTPVDPVPGVIA